MAVQKPTLPKGTRDFGPADVQKRRYILNTIETVFKKYGYMPLETPTMENLSTLEGKYGEEGDKLLFRVIDSGEPFEKIKLKLIPEKTVLVQNLLQDFFKELTDEILHYGYRSFENIHEHLGEHVHSFNVTATKVTSEERELISECLRANSIDIASELRKMVVLSGITKESNEEDIVFQLKNFRENKINKLTSDIISTFPEVALKFSKYSSKQINKEVTEKGLRYDLTVPFARYVVMNRNEITFPFKRYQMQPVWRADRPQKGRYREFWQCDADVVGSDSLLNELDLVQIYDEAFRKLGIGYEIRINNRKILAGIAQVVKSVEHMNTIATAIDKLDKIGVEGVRKELVEQGFTDAELDTLFSIISIKGESLTILNELKPKLASSAEGLKGIEELEFIFNALSSTNQAIRIKTDFSLARGLSYYTGCIFEVVADEGSLRSSIGGGGRYDNLTGIFGLPGVSGVGISFGLDRIYDVMEELKLFPQDLKATSTKVLFCHFDAATQQYCLPALKQLRDAGIAAEVYPDLTKKIGKQLDYANALSIPYAAIAGQTEMEQGLFNVKNLANGEQKPCTAQELIELSR